MKGRKRMNVPPSQKVEHHILEGVDVEGLFRAHNAPQIKNVPPNHLECRCGLHSPCIVSATGCSSRGARYLFANVQSWIGYVCETCIKA